MSARCDAVTLAVLLWGTRLAEPGIGPPGVGFVTVTTVVCRVTALSSRAQAVVLAHESGLAARRA
ncbi:hypothetical protein ABZ128_30430 [Streptomyces sp. NPDC006326]|uniref:hypothetical protein n=1 Tax=Streptomyces sp. NPDC006326 TaxID=3156752 RepID=UPI0033A5DCF2